MLAPETAAIRVHKYFKHLNTNVTRLEFLNFDVDTLWKPLSELSNIFTEKYIKAAALYTNIIYQI